MSHHDAISVKHPLVATLEVVAQSLLQVRLHLTSSSFFWMLTFFIDIELVSKFLLTVKKV
jgi:hypothetical protein